MNRCSADIRLMRKCLYVVIAALLSSVSLNAQQFSLSTNLLDYACLGTMNMDFSCSVSRHCSLTAGVRYNPFTFNSSDVGKQFQLRQRLLESGCGHGTRCQAGGLPENSVIRNITMAVCLIGEQRKATGMGAVCQQDTPICCRAI